MPNSTSSSADREVLLQLAQRGATNPAGLTPNEIVEVCKKLASILEEEDDLILRSRWRSRD